MKVLMSVLVASMLSSVSASALPIIGTGDPLDHLALNGGSQITFDDVDPRGDYGDLTLGGVKITSTPSFTITNEQNGAYNTRGTNHLTNHEDMQPEAFRFDFLHGTRAFAFHFGASDVEWLLAGYDANGAMAGSQVISPVRDSNAGDYFGLISRTEFHFATLTILTESADDYVMVDNITIAARAPSAVPLPAALPLLIFALGGLAAVKRGRISNSSLKSGSHNP